MVISPVVDQFGKVRQQVGIECGFLRYAASWCIACSFGGEVPRQEFLDA